MGRGEDILADWRQASKYLICSVVYLPVSQGAKADCGITELGRDRVCIGAGGEGVAG
jgi:hypothetical protein